MECIDWRELSRGENAELSSKFWEIFPDCDWGTEGCGITPREAIKLMKKSIATGHDYLSESFPDYPPDVFYD